MNLLPTNLLLRIIGLRSQDRKDRKSWCYWVGLHIFGDQDGKHASDLIKVLEGASQQVPSELHDMASRGGGYGRPIRRWGSSAPVGGGRGGGGGRNDSRGYVGRSSYGMSERGGCGSDRDSRDGGYQFKSFQWQVVMVVELGAEVGVEAHPLKLQDGETTTLVALKGLCHLDEVFRN